MPENLNFKRDHYCTEDQLGYDTHISALAAMIGAKNIDTPFCIGIYGPWGTGKTSFMRQIGRKLGELTPEEGAPRVIPVWFNPWRYEKEEHLIIPFLKTIQGAITTYAETHGRDGLEILKQGALRIGTAAIAFAYGMSADCKLGGVGFKFDAAKAAKREEELVGKRRQEAEKLAEELSSTYYDIISALEKALDYEKFRIVVFIDDLDRCLPEKAVELLESIKLFLDIEGYLFILGVDKEVVKKGISHRYKYYEDKDATAGKPGGKRIVSPEDYLDKMIQMPLDLPPIERSRKLGFIKTLLGESTFGEHAAMIEAGIKDNPRSITRFVNFLAFFGRLAEGIKKSIREKEHTPGRPENYEQLIENTFTPFFYVKWAIIVFAFPSEHELIKNTTKHLFDLQDAAIGKKQDAPREGEEQKDTIQVVPRLAKVLAMEPLFPEEPWLIRKYVHLASSIGLASEERNSYTKELHAMPQIGEMVKVNKGPFLYGDDKQTVNIEVDYLIDAYPVTIKQYAEFIKAGGYEKEELWSDAGWKWLKEQKRREPGLWRDEKWNQPDHPVVGVSYFEAEAYAAWAGKRLPTEQEWEKAARGDNGLEYPWGNEFDKEKCNSEESGIGKTTPVTYYPQGKSPYNCFDMVGNVWEWTSSDHEDYGKVIRGGSWDVSRDYSRCAARFMGFPFNGDYFAGFRCSRSVL